MTGSDPLLFRLEALVGVLFGAALCVRYLRHEIAADNCLRLRLNNLELAINLVLVTCYVEFGSQPLCDPGNRLPDRAGELP